MSDRTCSRCQQTKPERSFSRPSARYCKSCLVAYNRERREQRGDPTNARARQLLYRYNLTEAEYWQLHEAQDGRCALCRRKSGRNRVLDTDHDHETGEVRGLLCRECNFRFACLIDQDRTMLDRLATYFTEPPAREVLGGPRLVPSKVRDLARAGGAEADGE